MVLKVLGFVGRHLLAFGIGAGAVALYLTAHHNAATAAQAKIDALKDKAIASQAAQLGAVAGVRANDLQVIQSKDAALQTFADKMKAAGAKVTQQASTTVSIDETVPTKPTGVTQAGYSGPAFIEDEYGRFHFELPDGPMQRKQLFQFNAVVVKRLNGQYEFMKSDLREYVPGKDPSPATEIPVKGIITKSQFQFLEEAAPGPGFFHLRLEAAYDHRGAPGAGIQFANVKDRVNASLLGFYHPQDSELRAVLHVGYRFRIPFFETNISAGPYGGFSSKGGTVIGFALKLALSQ